MDALKATLFLITAKSQATTEMSMLTATQGVLSAELQSTSGSRVFKTRVLDFLSSVNIKAACMEETADGGMAIDLKPEEVIRVQALCKSPDSGFKFSLLKTPPLLRFDSPSPRPDGSSGNRSFDRDNRGNRSFGRDRGGRGDRGGFEKRERGDRDGYRS